jgi:hypothetical protein
LHDLAVFTGSSKYMSKKQRRIQRAKLRRKAALDKAAPKALNPYASDDSNNESGDVGSQDEGEEEEQEEMDDEQWAKAVQSGKISKGERLAPVDHSSIEYHPFRKVRCSDRRQGVRT